MVFFFLLLLLGSSLEQVVVPPPQALRLVLDELLGSMPQPPASDEQIQNPPSDQNQARGNPPQPDPLQQQAQNPPIDHNQRRGNPQVPQPDPLQHQTQGNPPQPLQTGTAANPVLQTKLDSLELQQRVVVDLLHKLRKDVTTLSSSLPGGNANTADAAYTEALEKLQINVAETRTVVERDVRQLRRSLQELQSQLVQTRTGEAGASGDLVKAVNDVREKMARVQEAIQVTTDRQQAIAKDIKSNKEELESVIERGTSYGFWTFLLLFQACFAFGFVWWRKLRDEASKKFV